MEHDVGMVILDSMQTLYPVHWPSSKDGSMRHFRWPSYLFVLAECFHTRDEEQVMAVY